MRLQGKRKKARLELLPLMDVIFIVLIFLVYSILNMTINKGLPVNLPTSRNAEKAQPTSVVLTINHEGALFINKDLVDREEICPALEKFEAVNNSEAPAIQIYADASVSFQTLYNALDLLKNCGVSRISLQAKSGN